MQRPRLRLPVRAELPQGEPALQVLNNKYNNNNTDNDKYYYCYYHYYY